MKKSELYLQTELLLFLVAKRINVFLPWYFPTICSWFLVFKKLVTGNCGDFRKLMSLVCIHYISIKTQDKGNTKDAPLLVIEKYFYLVDAQFVIVKKSETGLRKYSAIFAGKGISDLLTLSANYAREDRFGL